MKKEKRKEDLDLKNRTVMVVFLPSSKKNKHQRENKRKRR